MNYTVCLLCDRRWLDLWRESQWWEERLLYELAYCDDAVSVIGHIVYSLGPLLFLRHHSHSLEFFHPYIHYVLFPIGSSIPHQLMLFCGWLSLVRLKSAPAPCSRESMHQAAGSNSSSRENINLLLLWGRLASTDGLLTWGGDTILTMASFEIQLLTLWFCGFHNHEISVPFQGAVLVVCKICPTQSGDSFIQGYVPYYLFSLIQLVQM